VRFSIGIITAERSVDLIKKAHAAMSETCDIVYLPYGSMRHLSDAYERNAHRFDGLIFSGRFPYSYIVSHVGGILKPHAYFELTDRDYYRAFAGILFRRPGIDVSRILIEKPFVAIDFKELFAGASPSFFDPLDGDPPAIESAYEMMMRHSLSLWREKKIDLVVTRLTNLAETLASSGIPFELLFPSTASMLDAFHSLRSRIESRRLIDSMTASGVVAAHDLKDVEKCADLLRSLERFNGQNGMSLVIRKNREAFELTTSNETLRDITQGYTNCALTNCLHGEIGPSVCVGWGLGLDIVSSLKNAARAFKESTRSASHSAYLVNDLGEQIGPMASGKAVTLSASPSAAIEDVGAKIGISPANLQKLIDLQEKRGKTRFSSADLAFYLNVTPRSASRILARIAEYGGAGVAGNVQQSAKGRPYKIYDVDYRKLDPRLMREASAAAISEAQTA
jgi:hypothetical protein